MIKATVNKFKSFMQTCEVGDLVFVQKEKGWRAENFHTAIILEKMLFHHQIMVYYQDTMKEESISASFPKVILTSRQYTRYFFNVKKSSV